MALGILLLALWLAGFSLCIQLWLLTKPFSKTKRKRKPRRRPRPKSQHVPLETRLTSLLNGDQLTAQRLTDWNRRRHPGRSERWYWEKAIHDLERDRR
jgi:hypothetical protein